MREREPEEPRPLRRVRRRCPAEGRLAQSEEDPRKELDHRPSRGAVPRATTAAPTGGRVFQGLRHVAGERGALGGHHSETKLRFGEHARQGGAPPTRCPRGCAAPVDGALFVNTCEEQSEVRRDEREQPARPCRAPWNTIVRPTPASIQCSQKRMERATREQPLPAVGLHRTVKRQQPRPTPRAHHRLPACRQVKLTPHTVRGSLSITPLMSAETGDSRRAPGQPDVQRHEPRLRRRSRARPNASAQPGLRCARPLQHHTLTNCQLPPCIAPKTSRIRNRADSVGNRELRPTSGSRGCGAES